MPLWTRLQEHLLWPGCCTSTGQDGLKEIDMEWIGPVVAEFRHQKDSRAHYHAHGHALYAPMGKWPKHCISTCQVSKELDLQWIGPVDSRGLYYAHGHAHYAPMGNWLWHCTSSGQDSSNELDLEWIGQWLLSSSIHKFSGALITCMGLLIMAPWANDHDVAHLQAKTVPMNLTWSESAQCLSSSVIRNIPEALITDSRSPYCTHGHTNVAPMGKLPWYCTSTGQNGFNEPDLERIVQVVTDLWHAQSLGQMNGWMDEQTDGEHSIIPLFL